MARRKHDVQDETELNKGIEILEKHNIKVNEDRQNRLMQKEKFLQSNSKKLMRFFVIILLFVIIVLIINYAPILGLKLIDIPQSSIVIDNILNSESIYLQYNNELLVYNNGEIATYDKMGNKTWNYILSDGFIPSIYAYNQYLIVVNKANGMLYYFNNKKEIANKVIEGNIENIYIADDGRFVVQYTKDTGYKKIIAMYDKKAKLKYNEAYINSSPIIGIEFLNDENKLLIIQADSSLINIGTIFSLLDYNEQEYFKILHQFKDKLVYNYKLINDEIIYVSDGAVEAYNIMSDKNREIYSLLSSQTNFVSLYNNYFITVETKENRYELISKKLDNTVISSVWLTSYPKYVELSGLLTYIVSENSIDVINKWGVVTKKIDIALSPKEIVIFNNEKTVALIYSNKIEIVSL